ncbi:MAG TPA: hypothetical protein VKB38_15765 [Terracidiphilus sp.]|nr:hypothetical protein [Terracidiphilus sp.]
MFKQPVFWAAASAIIALLGFVFTHLVGRHWMRYWRLQRLLDRERSFYTTYTTMPRPPSAALIDIAGSQTQQYVSSVTQSLEGFDALPTETVRQSKAELRRLLSNLRATHQTLVSALEPFSITDAKEYFERFDSIAAKFATLYHGGQIPHEARTHCEEVDSVISELAKTIKADAPGWNKIASLRRSVVVYDFDVIIPLMTEVLGKAQVEISIIGQAIRSRDFRKAVYIKERFWFEVRGLYPDLNSALTKMSSLAARL